MPEWDYHGELLKYGYYIYSRPYYEGVTYTAYWGLAAGFEKFYYETQEITNKGHFIKGTLELKGERYPVTARLHPETSGFRPAGSDSFISLFVDADSVNRRLKKGQDYIIELFLVDKEEGGPMRYSWPTEYTEEEWVEIRSKIIELLENGGSTSDMEFMVSWVHPAGSVH